MATPCDIDKRRELVFHALPPGQAERALVLLTGLPGLVVSRQSELVLIIEYGVCDYTLEAIENALGQQGFHLESSLLVRIRRALVHYCEHIQRQNMGEPEVRTKNYQAFVEAWQHRSHGNHDETPEEWRQYR
jgi:hypothetical protein